MQGRTRVPPSSTINATATRERSVRCVVPPEEYNFTRSNPHRIQWQRGFEGVRDLRAVGAGNEGATNRHLAQTLIAKPQLDGGIAVDLVEHVDQWRALEHQPTCGPAKQKLRIHLQAN